ncbi:MAG: hypothetical protein ACLSFA_03730 [Roseburia inulinivorans]
MVQEFPNEEAFVIEKYRIEGRREESKNYGRDFLISHEDVSVSLLQSAELILGTQKNVYTYSLKRGRMSKHLGRK